jgi:hypothetical protein
MLPGYLPRFTQPLSYSVSFFFENGKSLKARITLFDKAGKLRNAEADSIVWEGQVTGFHNGFQLRVPQTIFRHNPLNDLPADGWFSFEKSVGAENDSWVTYWHRNPYPDNRTTEIFNTSVLQDIRKQKRAAMVTLSLKTTEIPKLFQNPYTFYSGDLDHRACTGTKTIFKTEFFLEDKPAEGWGDRRMGVFRFIGNNSGGSMARSSFITMRVWVTPGNNGTLYLETDGFSGKELTGSSTHYIADGSYKFTIQDPAILNGQISGFMRGPNGSRGQFRIKKSEEPTSLGNTVSLTPTQLLDSLRNQLAVFKGESSTVMDLATVTPITPVTMPLRQAAPEINDSSDFVKMSDELISLNQVNIRKNDTLHRISMPEVDSFFVHFYDNAVYDGDSISVFVNDELLVYKMELSQKPIELVLSKELGKIIVIRMLAENLGTIPPNTAVMVIRSQEGIKSYPMRADMATNGCVIITLE